jgi:hypothetical protein
MSEMDNESGIAYGIGMVALFFGAMAVLWLCFSYDVNIILENYFNQKLAEGTVSEQTLNSVNFQVNALRYGIPALFIGGFIWGVRRAIYKKEGGA